MVNKCRKCREAVVEKDTLKCDGPWGELYHYKCLKLSKSNYEIWLSCAQLKYICSSCEKNLLNIQK